MNDTETINKRRRVENDNLQTPVAISEADREDANKDASPEGAVSHAQVQQAYSESVGLLADQSQYKKNIQQYKVLQLSLKNM